MDPSGTICISCCRALLQSKFSIEYLPAFAAWHSDALPYRYLLVLQALIILLYGYICVQFTLAKIVPERIAGKIFLCLGAGYAGIMIIRLLVGLFISSPTWFQAYLPIFFHLDLASFLILVGLFHLLNVNSYE